MRVYPIAASRTRPPRNPPVVGGRLPSNAAGLLCEGAEPADLVVATTIHEVFHAYEHEFVLSEREMAEGAEGRLGRSCARKVDVEGRRVARPKKGMASLCLAQLRHPRLTWANGSPQRRGLAEGRPSD